MKKVTFIICSIVLFFSCSGPSETAYEPIETPDTTLVEGGATDYAITPDEFLELAMALPEKSPQEWEVKHKIKPNPHEKNLDDTLTTMRYKESIIHLHNHGLLDSYIVNNEVELIKNIRVGMTRASFVAIFKKLENNKDAPFIDVSPELIKIGCCSEQNNMWTFHFDADTIYQIDYNGYVD